MEAIDQSLIAVSSQLISFTIRLIAAACGIIGLVRKSPGFTLLFWIVYTLDVIIYTAGALVSLVAAGFVYGIVGILVGFAVLTIVIAIDLTLTAVVYSYYLSLKAEKLKRRETQIIEEHAALIGEELEPEEDDAVPPAVV